MKNKILTLIIGILIGAIIATGGIYAYISINYGTPDTADESSTNELQGEGGEVPEMPDGEDGEAPEMPGGEDGEAPEMPDGEDGEVPEKPDGDGEMPSDMPERGEQASGQSGNSGNQD